MWTILTRKINSIVLCKPQNSIHVLLARELSYASIARRSVALAIQIPNLFKYKSDHHPHIASTTGQLCLTRTQQNRYIPRIVMIPNGRGSIALVQYTGDEAAMEIKKLLEQVVSISSGLDAEAFALTLVG